MSINREHRKNLQDYLNIHMREFHMNDPDLLTAEVARELRKNNPKIPIDTHETL